MEPPTVLAAQRLTIRTRGDSAVAQFCTERGGPIPDAVNLTQHLLAALPDDCTIEISSQRERFAVVHEIAAYGAVSAAELALRLEQILPCLLIVPAWEGRTPTSVFALDWQTRPKLDIENVQIDPDDPLSSVPLIVDAEDSAFERTDVGWLEYRAKWKRDESSAHDLGRRLAAVAKAHDGMGRCNLVLAAPSRYDLSFRLATSVANAIGAEWAVCHKQDRELIQSSAEGADHAERQAGNVVLPDLPRVPSAVLVIDDLYATGSTLMEVTRCLDSLGIRHIYGLVATKSLKHHRQV